MFDSVSSPGPDFPRRAFVDERKAGLSILKGLTLRSKKGRDAYGYGLGVLSVNLSAGCEVMGV